MTSEQELDLANLYALQEYGRVNVPWLGPDELELVKLIHPLHGQFQQLRELETEWPGDVGILRREANFKGSLFEEKTVF